MKKRKLNLDKKSIAKLSEENLENIHGGGGIMSFCCPSFCTGITITEPEEPAILNNIIQQDITIVWSCK